MVLTQDSRLHTQRACDQADFLNPTPLRMLHCSLQSRVMFCSELHVVTQPHHQCPAPPPVASTQQTWGQERGGSVQTAGGRTGYNAALTSSPHWTADSPRPRPLGSRCRVTFYPQSQCKSPPSHLLSSSPAISYKHGILVKCKTHSRYMDDG